MGQWQNMKEKWATRASFGWVTWAFFFFCFSEKGLLSDYISWDENNLIPVTK
jgi:hypothetical protein